MEAERLEPLPYVVHHPFAYSLRCIKCRHEVRHSQQEHDALRAAWGEDNG